MSEVLCDSWPVQNRVVVRSEESILLAPNLLIGQMGKEPTKPIVVKIKAQNKSWGCKSGVVCTGIDAPSTLYCENGIQDSAKKQVYIVPTKLMFVCLSFDTTSLDHPLQIHSDETCSSLHSGSDPLVLRRPASPATESTRKPFPPMSRLTWRSPGTARNTRSARGRHGGN